MRLRKQILLYPLWFLLLVEAVIMRFEVEGFVGVAVKEWRSNVGGCRLIVYFLDAQKLVNVGESFAGQSGLVKVRTEERGLVLVGWLFS